MAVIERVLREWPEIKAPRLTEMLRDEHGYQGSVDLVRRKLSSLRPREERAAQRTGYRPGQVVQFDWGEMPTRPRIGGVERRVYALVASLPFCGAQTAHFSFDMTIESFLEGHVRVFDWLGGVPRECVYDNLRSAVAKRDSRQVVRWNQRFLHLRGHYAFHSTACTPATPREKGSVEGAVRYLKTGFWPARRFQTLGELDRVYGDWRDRVAHRRRHATRQFIVADRLVEDRAGAAAAATDSALISRCAGRCGSRPTAICATARAFIARRSSWCISAWSCTPPATRCGSAGAARSSSATRGPIGPGCGSPSHGAVFNQRQKVDSWRELADTVADRAGPIDFSPDRPSAVRCPTQRGFNSL